MGFLLAVLSFVVAEEVVELETVGAGNTYGCDKWKNVQTVCEGSPYCRWGGTGLCYDDPCLKLMKDGQVCDSQTVDGVMVYCAVTSATVQAQWKDGDCGDDKTVVDLCVQANGPPPSGTPVKSSSVYTYCVYAQLRDGSCPSSVCREYDPQATDNKVSKHCIRNAASLTGCNILSEDDCKLVPKCYIKDSKCEVDPCWGLESTVGSTCEGYHPGGDSKISCKSFKPYKKNGAGNVETYCVISANSNPNLCYLGNPGYDSTSTNDYGKTYPTLNISSSTGSLVSKPVCATTGTSCDNMGNCTLVVNKKGAFAGAYCSDGTHGAANILHIPSLFVVLLIALVSMLNF